MERLLSLAETGSRSLSYLFGGLAIALAVAVLATSMGPSDIAAWSLKVFGASYLALSGGLVFVTVFAWTKLSRCHPQSKERRLWVEVGGHGANGVSTLALTYTLLGIALGIGTLAHQELNPQTVQGIIQELTDHFSMAFMTTVVGLPISALLRALIDITDRKLDAA